MGSKILWFLNKYRTVPSKAHLSLSLIRGRIDLHVDAEFGAVNAVVDGLVLLMVDVVVSTELKNHFNITVVTKYAHFVFITLTLYHVCKFNNQVHYSCMLCCYSV